MVKFEDLKVEQLKKELAARNQVTSGTKAELQKRLRETMEAEGECCDEYEFDYGTGSSQMDLSTILAVLKQNAAEIKESAKQSAAELNSKMEQNAAEIKASVEGKFKEIDANFQDIRKQQTDLESDFNALKQEVLELKSKPVLVRSNQEPSVAKMKAPTFDGTTSFNVFKLQFETIAAANGWSRGEMASTLVVALRGNAAEVLQMVPQSELGSYELIMEALHRRFGSEHKKQIYQMEAINRKQFANESLKDFATDVERLAHLAYADETPEYREKQMIQTFVAGIRDAEIKKAALCFPKATFAETVGFALTQETATLLSRPVYKVKQIQAEPESCLEVLFEQLSKFMAKEKHSKFTGKCYNCCANGHIARNCTKKRTREQANDATQQTTNQPNEPLN